MAIRLSCISTINMIGRIGAIFSIHNDFHSYQVYQFDLVYLSLLNMNMMVNRGIFIVLIDKYHRST
jgi:hypothetical protein